MRHAAITSVAGVANVPAQALPPELTKHAFVDALSAPPMSRVYVDESKRPTEVHRREPIAPLPGCPSQFALRRADERIVPIEQTDQPARLGQSVAGVEIAVQRLPAFKGAIEFVQPVVEFGVLELGRRREGGTRPGPGEHAQFLERVMKARQQLRRFVLVWSTRMRPCTGSERPQRNRPAIDSN